MGALRCFGLTSGRLVESVEPLQIRFPRLFSYVKDPWILVSEAFQSQDVNQMFHLPLSVQAHVELRVLQDDVSSIILNEDKDI